MAAAHPMEEKPWACSVFEDKPDLTCTPLDSVTCPMISLPPTGVPCGDLAARRGAHWPCPRGRWLVPHASHIRHEHGAAHDEKSGDDTADCPRARVHHRQGRSGCRGHPDDDQGELTAGGTREPAPLWHVAGPRQAGAR